MIDIEKMHASISKIRHIFGDDVRATQSLGEVFELINRLREAERDAARYRWLRNCTTVESKRFVSDSGGWIVGLGVLDGMIDQAMKEKGDE